MYVAGQNVSWSKLWHKRRKSCSALKHNLRGQEDLQVYMRSYARKPLIVERPLCIASFTTGSVQPKTKRALLVFQLNFKSKSCANQKYNASFVLFERSVKCLKNLFTILHTVVVFVENFQRCSLFKNCQSSIQTIWISGFFPIVKKNVFLQCK